MKKLVIVVMLLALSACASIDLTTTKLAVATHNDIQAAAAYAEANGYPERAAVRRAIDAQLTACERAISAALPKAVTGSPGPILLAEMAEEAAGTGVPSAVRVNCAPLPLIRLPGLP